MSKLVRLIASDLNRYTVITGTKLSLITDSLFTQGFWATIVFRLAAQAHKIDIPIVNTVLRVLFLILSKFIEIITSIRLPYTCEIGKGLYIGHFGPVILNSKVKIGDNCNLSQCVTIGEVQHGERKGVPVIGDRVYIGPNAVVIGNVQIGNDVAIGAGSVVIKSVPDRGVVVGNPARIVSYNGSFDLIRYRGMETDPARIAALEQKGNPPEVELSD